MKLHSISTDLGAAILAEIKAPIHPVEAPEGWGLIFWGRCDRSTFGSLALSSKAKWIADYDIKSKLAIVMCPPHLAGKTFAIDTTCVDSLCPNCGSTEYTSSGVNWRCGKCDRQWRKELGRRGRPKKAQ